MIHDLVIADAIGPDLVAPHPRSELASALGVDLLGLRDLGVLGHLGGQHNQGHPFVGGLGPAINANGKPAGAVQGADACLHFVPMLAPRPTATGDADLDFSKIQGRLGPLICIKDRHGDGGGVNPTMALGGRDPLPPVAAALGLEEPEVLSLDEE